MEEPLTINVPEVFPPLPQPDLPVGGRLGHFANNWEKVTKDKWVLSVVKNGYKIPFDKRPQLSPSPLFLSQTESKALEEEVQKLLQKGAVERVYLEDPGYYSRIFLVPKKNGKLRLIIDLSKLNTFLNIQSFSMETANKVRNAILPKDWTFSIDLTDAYLHVPIHVTSRKFLRFCLKGKVFQFQALPFGLATSPFVFTRLMLAIATHLRVRAIVLFPYLDDWLVRNQNRLRLIRDRQFTLQLITSLGLIINQEKSDLTLSQNFVFIGMEFRTAENIVRVPWDRVQAILQLIPWFQSQFVSARMSLSLLGKLNATAQFVILGRLHLRPLQMALFSQWKPHILPLEHKIWITDPIKTHLKWWDNKDRFIQGVPLKPPPVSHTVFSDASVSGWGAHLEPEGVLCHGVWTQDQSLLHINVLEMKAVLLALKQFQNIIGNSSVMIVIDNASVVAYIRKEGGDPFSISMHGGVGDSPLVSQQGNLPPCKTHTREKQYPRRPVVADIETDINGMVPGSDNLQCNLHDDGSSEYRPVCDPSQQQTSVVCISHSRQESSFSRCLVNELGQDSRICVSSISHNPSYSEQNSRSSVQDSSDCSILATSGLVSRTSTATSSSSHFSPVSSKSSKSTKRKNLSSESSNACLTRLDIIKQSVRDRKFSQKLPIMSPRRGEFQQGKSMTQNGKSLFLGAVEVKFLLSRPLLPI